MRRSDIVGFYSQTRDKHNILKFHKNICRYVCLSVFSFPAYNIATLYYAFCLLKSVYNTNLYT